MTDTDGGIVLYLAFTLSTSEDQARARFVERYGREPERCERMVYAHWPGETPWGVLLLGPVPQAQSEAQQ